MKSGTEMGATHLVVDTEQEPFNKKVYIFSYTKTLYLPKRSEAGLVLDIITCGLELVLPSPSIPFSTTFRATISDVNPPQIIKPVLLNQTFNFYLNGGS